MDTPLVLLALTLVTLIVAFVGQSGYRWIWLACSSLAITTTVLTTPVHQIAMIMATTNLPPFSASGPERWEDNEIETFYRPSGNAQREAATTQLDQKLWKNVAMITYEESG